MKLSAHSAWFLEDSWVPEKYVPAIYQTVLTPLRGLYSVMPDSMRDFARRTVNHGNMGKVPMLQLMPAIAASLAVAVGAPWHASEL